MLNFVFRSNPTDKFGRCSLSVIRFSLKIRSVVRICGFNVAHFSHQVISVSIIFYIEVPMRPSGSGQYYMPKSNTDLV